MVDIFIRCLSYRLIKIHRKFTSADLLCDEVSLKKKELSFTLICVEILKWLR
jgi:hypothetical protein